MKPCSQKAVRCHIYNSERGIMSARWQSKGSYTSSLHRNIALTIILVPKYLREKFRIQLSSRSTLEEHKLRSSQIYMGKKSNFSLLTSVPPPNRINSAPRTSPQPMILSGKDGETGGCTGPRGLSECLRWSWFLSCLILSNEQPKELCPLIQLETK